MLHKIAQTADKTARVRLFCVLCSLSGEPGCNQTDEMVIAYFVDLKLSICFQYWIGLIIAIENLWSAIVVLIPSTVKCTVDELLLYWLLAVQRNVWLLFSISSVMTRTAPCMTVPLTKSVHWYDGSGLPSAEHCILSPGW